MSFSKIEALELALTSLNNTDNNNNSFWKRYEQYLAKNFNRSTAKARFSYAKEYWPVLNGERNTTSDLLLLSDAKRIHVMKSLSTLAKFIGCYDRWQDIRERHQLKWSSGQDSVEAFRDITHSKCDLNVMIAWLKNTYSKIPRTYGNILVFDTLTGLRPDETIQSLRLLKADIANYYNKENQTLEHFKYPSIFFRRTKKPYITIVNDKILEIANHCGNCSYVAVRLYLRHKNIPMHMAYCRKIYATYLRSQGIEPEIIDLLQGRAPKSVFARHYYKPDFMTYKDKILDCVESLYNKVIT